MLPPKTGSFSVLLRGIRRTALVPLPITRVASGGRGPSNRARTTIPLPRSTLVSPGVTVTLREDDLLAHFTDDVGTIRNPKRHSASTINEARAPARPHNNSRVETVRIHSRFWHSATASRTT